MSKYNLLDIHEGMGYKDYERAQEEERLDKHPDKEMIKKIKAMMAKEKSVKEGDAVDLAIEASQDKAGIKEDKYDDIVNADDDIPAGKKKAAALAYRKVDKGDSYENATSHIKSNKNKMNEVRIDKEVANKIEGMLSRPLKAQFLDAFDDIWEDLTEDDMFYPEDVINHLNNEMHKRLSLYRTPDPKPEEIPMFMGTRDALDDISIREEDKEKDKKPRDGVSRAAAKLGIKPSHMKEIDSTLDPYEDRDEIIKQVMSLLIKEKGASKEELKGFIETHMDDILNAGDDDDIVDEFTQYLSVNEPDIALREHFGRFLKDYQ
tara:strand:- start:315 stop:1271 length:957 start_codon:yes stop_codon:yes gene_type:complete